MAASVLVPLYLYPSMGAWDPVYHVATSYPQVQFTAIVNVHNGPGDGALPNPEYSYAIETLNSLHNVRTVGYVSTTWCTRDLTSVLDDIAAYSFWGEYTNSLAIDGIFVDETPTQYSPGSVTYLQTIAEAIRESDGLKEGYIVHNPGALPAPQFFQDSIDYEGTHTTTDLTVIFENSFSNWTAESQALTEATKTYNRTKLAVVVHTVPDLNVDEVATTLKQLLAVGHSIWLTGNSNYTNLDDHLQVFVESLAVLLSIL